jgi:hypothetical protein
VQTLSRRHSVVLLCVSLSVERHREKRERERDKESSVANDVAMTVLSSSAARRQRTSEGTSIRCEKSKERKVVKRKLFSFTRTFAVTLCEQTLTAQSESAVDGCIDSSSAVAALLGPYPACLQTDSLQNVVYIAGAMWSCDNSGRP